VVSLASLHNVEITLAAGHVDPLPFGIEEKIVGVA
jgi:hypothetical protein